MEELLDRFIGVQLQLRTTELRTYTFRRYFHRTHTFTVLFARYFTEHGKLVLFLNKDNLKFIIYPRNKFFKNFIRDILSLVNGNKLVIHDRKRSSIIASNKFGKGGRNLNWYVSSRRL